MTSYVLIITTSNPLISPSLPPLMSVITCLPTILVAIQKKSLGLSFRRTERLSLCTEGVLSRRRETASSGSYHLPRSVSRSRVPLPEPFISTHLSSSPRQAKTLYLSLFIFGSSDPSGRCRFFFVSLYDWRAFGAEMGDHQRLGSSTIRSWVSHIQKPYANPEYVGILPCSSWGSAT